jgi:hypothetical protein
MDSLARASLYRRSGLGYALRVKRSGRGVASSGNWRQLFDGEDVRMRFFSIGMNVFWLFAAVSPSAKPRVFRGCGLL